MTDEDPQTPSSLEEALRAMAQEISRSIERIAELDLDQWFTTLSERMSEQFDQVRHAARPAEAEPETTPFGGADPHPLDTPTNEQGRALAALDSGRWVLEPGTSALAAHGEGPGPRDALGLVRELRVRDWLTADGEVTVAGKRALARWLERG